MRIKGCNAHNACRGNGGGKGLGAVRAIVPIGVDGLGAVVAGNRGYSLYRRYRGMRG